MRCTVAYNEARLTTCNASIVAEGHSCFSGPTVPSDIEGDYIPVTKYLPPLATQLSHMTHRGDGSTNDEGRDLSKVERVVESYGLVGHGDRLVEYWTGTDGEQRSTRELAEWFNQEVLEAAIQESGMSVRAGEGENLYRLLTDDDVSRGNRTQTELELEREGVDVDAVESDFVSHQTIYNYLTNVRDVERSSDDGGLDIETVRSRIQRLVSRTQAVTVSNLTSLRNGGALSIGSFSVNVRITVYCEDCGQQFDLTDLYERGRCGCEDTG